MSKKKHIAILVGGPSSEFEVSMKSGDAVYDAIESTDHRGTKVVIDRGGLWGIHPEEVKSWADCAFVALHGTYGEDGTVQRVLEDANIPYTGSNALASALGMNKFLSMRVFQDIGLHVPHTKHITKIEWRKDYEKIIERIEKFLGYPCVIKPNNQGSSVGVFIIKTRKEMKHALGEVFLFGKDALAQEYVSGRELTCGVLDHGWSESAFPLLPTEIIPQSDHFFNYEAKYTPGASLEITPPENMERYMIRKIQQTALLAHRSIGARGFSRTDMILEPGGRLVVLEINTIPGLTSESLLPKAALASGIPFPKLIDIIIKSALFR